MKLTDDASSYLPSADVEASELIQPVLAWSAETTRGDVEIRRVDVEEGKEDSYVNFGAEEGGRDCAASE